MRLTLTIEAHVGDDASLARIANDAVEAVLRAAKETGSTDFRPSVTSKRCEARL